LPNFRKIGVAALFFVLSFCVAVYVRSWRLNRRSDRRFLKMGRAVRYRSQGRGTNTKPARLLSEDAKHHTIIAYVIAGCVGTLAGGHGLAHQLTLWVVDTARF